MKKPAQATQDLLSTKYENLTYSFEQQSYYYEGKFKGNEILRCLKTNSPSEAVKRAAAVELSLNPPDQQWALTELNISID